MPLRQRLLDFSRFVTDVDYLFAKLSPYLPGIAIDQARQAFASVVDPAKIRVGTELGAVSQGNARPDMDRLNRLALQREVVRLRREIARQPLPQTSGILHFALRLRRKLRSLLLLERSRLAAPAAEAAE